MFRIIAASLCFLLCTAGSSQENQNPVPNEFDFMAEIGQKYDPSVKPYPELYENLYAQFVKEKLKAENPGFDDETLTALSRMVVKPVNEMISLDIDLQSDNVLIQYYNALSFMAGGQNNEATSLLTKCLNKSPTTSYTRLFIFQSLIKIHGDRTLKKHAQMLFEKLVLSRGVTAKDAKVLYRLTYDMGEPFLAELAQKVKKSEKIDRWYKLILQGQAGIYLAWQARGDGWASTVTPEGWKGFFANLNKAEKALVEAWKFNPTHPEAAMLMITVCMGLQDKKIDDCIKWFKRSIEAQFDYYPAYRAIATAIAPKWGGSGKLRLNLASACLKYGGSKSKVPLYGIKVLLDIAEDIDDYRWQLVFAIPEISGPMRKWAAEKVKQAVSQEEKDQALTLQALVDIYTLHYQHAGKVLEELPVEIFEEELGKLRAGRVTPVASWIDPARIIKVFTGKSGDELAAIEKNFLKRNKTDAMLALFTLIRSKKLNKDEKEFAIDFYAKMGIGKSASYYDFFNGNALHTAIWNRVKPAFIRTLLNMGIDCNKVATKSRRTALITAARRDSPIEIIDMLKNAGADLNGKDKFGWTALEHAINKRNLDFAAHLIKLGADINTFDNSNYPLILRAFSWNCDKAADMLLAAGANLNLQISDGRSLLMIACSRNLELSTIKKLLDHDVDLERRCQYKGTALIYAAKFHHDPEALKLLIAKGAKLDVGDKDGDTSLISAAAWGKNPEKVRVLVEAGADINKKNNAGRTPLIMTVISRNGLDEIKILVENGAKLNETDKNGLTAYDWAVKKNKQAIADYLKKHGAQSGS